MLKRSFIYLLLAGLSFSSCAGVKFGESTVNATLPDVFKDKAVYPAGVAGYKFEDLVGVIILVKKGQDPLPIGLIRPTAYVRNVIPITDPNNYYKSRIQKGAEAQGSYLSFAANFSADRMAELELSDIARAGIHWDGTNFDEVITQAAAWVESHPNADPTVTRIWVKDVVLTKRIYSDYTKIAADASGQVGPVVGVKGGIYNNAENVIKSVILSFDAYDIDKMVSNAKSVESIGGTSIDRIKFSKVKNTIDGQIKPDGKILKAH